MIEKRVRVPVRLAAYTSLINVGVRHLLVSERLTTESAAEPLKQVRIKFDDSVFEQISSIQTRFNAKFGVVVKEALERAAQSSLNPDRDLRPDRAA